MSSPRILSAVKEEKNNPSLKEMNLKKSLLKNINPSLLEQLSIPQEELQNCKGLAEMYLSCVLLYAGIVKAHSCELTLFPRTLNTYFQQLGKEDASTLLSKTNKIIKELIDEGLKNTEETASEKIKSYQNLVSSLPKFLKKTIDDNKFSNVLVVKSRATTEAPENLPHYHSFSSIPSQNDLATKILDETTHKSNSPGR